MKKAVEHIPIIFSFTMLIGVLFFYGCGGGGGGDDDDDQPVAAATPAPTPIEVSNFDCEDSEQGFESADVEAIVDAANEESVPVNEITSEPTIPTLDCGSAGIAQCTRAALLKFVVVNANCGSQVVIGGDTVEDNDNVIVNPSPSAAAQRVIAAIRAGKISAVEVRR